MIGVRSFVRRWFRQTRGQDLIEYAVLASFVALVTFGAVFALGIALNNWLTAIGNRVR